ncbi:MAG TPA: ABC-ATPase domain-containing protein [Bacillota bacterium]|nr:ABC-ATPase domain-containing protein [Bacillota bacterium]
MQQLLKQLNHIDKKGYKAYKGIQGTYSYPEFQLCIDYVQGDPFASPSRIRIIIPENKRPLQPEWLMYPSRVTATEDRIARAVGKAVSDNSISIRGSGKSGAILFDTPKQEVIKRSAVMIDVDKKATTVCLSVGLPANGRRINGREARKLFEIVIPSIIQSSVLSLSKTEIEKAVQLNDQQEHIRKEIRENDWVAFIANDSILPRKSGVSDKPLQGAIQFQSPTENEVSITLPHQSEPIKGMAIKRGITLIVGGGYHGKSTILEAIERGVYPHIAGDGREYVLTDPDAVKIRAEDGRKISGVDISPFINHLPHKQDTQFFSTDNASGSTSQAANVMEALEAGASTLLIDEDTSATNFMIRDHRIEQIVRKAKEPITPFLDKIGVLRDDLGVSTILVMGGSGAYFSVADDVIMMDEYVPENVTQKARDIMEQSPLVRKTEDDTTFGTVRKRSFQQASLQTKKGKRSKTQAKGLTTILMGRTEIAFHDTEQLVDPSQTRLIADIIQYMDQKKILDGITFTDLLDRLEHQMDRQGIHSFSPFPKQHPGDVARPRRHEIAAVLNRIRTAKVVQK